MKIAVSQKPVPGLGELKAMLEHQYEGKYRVHYFGWGPNKSVVVKKSFFVGAHVRARDSKRLVTVSGSFPSIPSVAVAGIVFFLGALVGFLILLAIFYKPWKKFEKEVGEYITQAYSNNPKVQL